MSENQSNMEGNPDFTSVTVKQELFDLDLDCNIPIDTSQIDETIIKHEIDYPVENTNEPNTSTIYSSEKNSENENCTKKFYETTIKTELTAESETGLSKKTQHQSNIINNILENAFKNIINTKPTNNSPDFQKNTTDNQESIRENAENTIKTTEDLGTSIVEIKQEVEDCIVSYDLPQFHDETTNGSISTVQSNEVIQDDISLKLESNCDDEQQYPSIEPIQSMEIKSENNSFDPYTQTKNIISAHSTTICTTSSKDSIPTVTRTVVMEIMPLDSMQKPDESILPNEHDANVSFDETNVFNDAHATDNEGNMFNDNITYNTPMFDLNEMRDEMFRSNELLEEKRSKIGISCPVCYKNYKTHFKLQTHMIKFHNAKFEKDVKIPINVSHDVSQLLQVKKDKNDLLYFCPKCPDKVFNSHASLTRHLDTHKTIMKRRNGIIGGLRVKAIKYNMNVNLSNTVLDSFLGANEVIEPYACHLCPKHFKEERSVRRHLFRVHLKDKVKKDTKEYEYTSRLPKGNYECKKCGKKYTFNGSLERHERNCTVTEKTESKYVCVCGKKYHRRSPMEACLRSHNPSPEVQIISCALCSKQFDNKAELFLHKKTTHANKRYACKFCPTDFRTMKELISHLTIHKKVQMLEFKAVSEVVENKKKLKCFICATKFSELPDIKKHVLEDHKNPFKCQHCNESYEKINEFVSHTKTKHPKTNGPVLDILEAFTELAKAWRCDECEIQFENPDKLVIHQHEHKNTQNNEGLLEFQCEHCRRAYPTAKQLNNHKRRHHDCVTNEKPEPIGPLCVHCRKICQDEAALTSHLRLHSTERKYICRFCDFRFATLEKKKTHESIHTGDMKFVCFICEYRCSSENRLKVHKNSQKHADTKDMLLNWKAPVLDNIEDIKTTSEDNKSSSQDKKSISPESKISSPAETSPLKTQAQDKQPSTSKKRSLSPKSSSTKDKSNSSKDKSSSSSKRRQKSCSEGSSDGEFSCDICGEKFSNEANMIEHKQTHPFITFLNEDNSKIFFT